MQLNRRTFVEYCALGAATVAVRRSSRVIGPPSRTLIVPGAADPPDATAMLALARRAVEAATAAGAVYADVRLTHALTEQCEATTWHGPYDLTPLQRENPGRISNVSLLMGIGVRALIDGYWGFAASPIWSVDEAALLGTEAAAQARTNAHAGGPRTVDLGRVSNVRGERWVAPGVDPFTVPIDEKLDTLRGFLELVAHQDRTMQGKIGKLELWREERVFASSEGASFSQVRYRTLIDGYGVIYRDQYRPPEVVQSNVLRPWTANYARGWDLVQDLDLHTIVPSMIAEAQRPAVRTQRLRRPVDVGRYDLVLGGLATAKMLSATLGVATQLDRALGYEANAAGTSYLGPDPMQYLGTSVGSPLVSVTADRSTEGGLNTVQWDDEGVRPQPFTLVDRGALVDYQTTREFAGVLSPWYARRHQSVASHGCSVAETALHCPLDMMPNLTLTPGAASVSTDDLIRDTKRGIYWSGEDPYEDASTDLQAKTGVYSGGDPREIRDGRLGDVLVGAGALFSSLEFWKNVMSIGGAATTQSVPRWEKKGEPSQVGLWTSTAPAVKVTGVAIFDVTRRA